jgi:DNA-binding transcriptional LysR family regulator
MPDHLPPDLLRTFLAALDAGGVMRAAPRVGRTRSAVSLQMRRLEDVVGRPLFRRAGRRLEPTPAGEALAGWARRLLRLNDEALAALRDQTPPEVIRVGAPQDVAERWLPPPLARFARAHPHVRLELRVDHSRVLSDLRQQGALDLAVRFALDEREGPAGGQHLGTLPTAFFASPALAWRPGEPLPLILLEAPCIFRSAALRALDAEGLAWRLAGRAPSVSAVWAAVAAGLGVTARAPVAVPRGVRAMRAGLLPALPPVALVLEGDDAATASAQVMRRELAAALRARLATARRPGKRRGVVRG